MPVDMTRLPSRSGRTSSPIAWTSARHHFVGFIGFADGSVQWANNSNLVVYLTQTGLATDRLVIP